MKAVVTGGSGFIGSHLAESLLKLGSDVAVIDNLSTGRRENMPAGADLHVLDIRDTDGLEDALTEINPDVIFHLAAQMDVRVSTRDPVFDAECNIIGSINVIEAGLKADCARIVYANTGGALYGEVGRDELPVKEDFPVAPLSQYGISKHTVEHYLHLYAVNYGLNYTSLRLPNVYGPRQDPHGEAGVVAIFLDKMLEQQPVTVFGDGSNTRDYTHVADVASAAILVAELPGEHIYNLGTGVETSVLEIVKSLSEIVGTGPSGRDFGN